MVHCDAWSSTLSIVAIVVSHLHGIMHARHADVAQLATVTSTWTGVLLEHLPEHQYSQIEQCIAFMGTLSHLYSMWQVVPQKLLFLYIHLQCDIEA